MCFKYCKKLHPTIVQNAGFSHVWKKMLQVREEVEHQIGWHIRATNYNFGYDNQTKQGALIYVDGDKAMEDEVKVKEFIRLGQWNIDILRLSLSKDMVDYISTNTKHVTSEVNDKACQMPETLGDFSIKSTFQLMRHKKNEATWIIFVWVKRFPSKKFFFL